MMQKSSILFVAVLASLMATASARAVETSHYDFSGTTPLVLKPGVNRISHFDAKGRKAEIIYAWRENMNSHSYGIYSVLMPKPDTTNDWALVTFDTHDNGKPNGGEVDSLYSEPFDGELPISSVRFLKAKWEGHPATLVITARRDLSHMTSFIDSGLVEFSIYKLTANDDGVPGWPYYYFDRVAHFTSDTPYCNSDLALTKVLHLPLPDDHSGPDTDDGCIP